MKKLYRFVSILCCLAVPVLSFSQTIRFADKISSGLVERLHHSSDYFLLDSKSRIPPAYGLTLCRVNTQGSVVWAKQYPGDSIQVMKVLGDDGALLIGTRNHAVTVIRTDSSGSVVWSKEYVSYRLQLTPAMVQICGVDLASDGSFLVCAQNKSTNTSNPNPFLVFSGDINGTLKWVRGFTGMMITSGPVAFNGPNSFNGGFSMMVLGTGPEILSYRSDSATHVSWVRYASNSAGFIEGLTHAGTKYLSVNYLSTSSGSGTYAIISMYDSVMNTLKTAMFYSSIEIMFNAVEPTSDKGYIACGFLRDGGAFQHALLTKTDSALQVQWTKEYHIQLSPGLEQDINATIVHQTPDKGFVFSSGGYLFKTDSMGTIGCKDTPSAPAITYTGPSTNTPSNSFLTADTIAMQVIPLSMTSVTTTFTDSLACFFVTGVQEQPEALHMELMPNPCSDKLLVNYESASGKAEMQVYTVLGKLVYSQKTQDSLTEINTSDWSPGLYFLSIKNENAQTVRKVIKQ